MAELTSALRFSRKSRRAGLLAYWDLYRQRRSLASLDDHMLRDLGMTRDQAQHEADRPVWDAPAHWGR